MTRELDVRLLPESDYPLWETFNAEAPAGSIYGNPRYLDTLCRTVGGRFRILAAKRGGEIRGGIALYERVVRPGGRILGPRALFYYNGPVLRAFVTRYPSKREGRINAVLSALEGSLSALGYARLQLRCRHPLTDARVFLERGWDARPSYTHEVSLKDPDLLHGRIEQNLRRLVRRCQESGVRMAREEDFDAFFRMHEDTHRRKGAPLYLSAEPFRRYFEELSGAGLCRLYHARKPDGRSIAAQLVLADGHPVTHTVAAAADAENLAMGGNAFLRTRVLETLAEEGYLGHDLTHSPLGPVSHFKSQLGGDLRLGLVLSRPDTRGFRFMKKLRPPAAAGWLRKAKTRR